MTEFPRTELTIAGSAPVKLSVIDVGPDEPPGRGTIVCTHGAGGDARQWTPQINHFRRHYRVIAPDLRGHGRSEHPDSAYSLEEFLWDVTQLLTKLQVSEPFILMAHSFGGPIALTFTAAHPERVRRLILIATAPEMHLRPMVELLLKLPLPLRILERIRPLVASQIHAPLFVLQRVLAGTLFPWRGWSLLPTVRVPTLIIGGQFDFIVPVSVLNRMRAAMPTARFELVRYARHLPHLERPEAVNRHIEGFIARRQNWRGEEERIAEA
ncbi:MAG TPA: alpha/beta fold hydrolase [Roseiflexaceae bacterium]|nr:alpha/beta fold hydrolase [Roseiflexaceae bacterium]